MTTTKGFEVSILGHFQFLSFVILLAGTPVWAANPGKLIHTFSGGASGQNSATQMIFDAAGNIYGTAGTEIVFKMTPIDGGGWNYQVIYDFIQYPWGWLLKFSKGKGRPQRLLSRWYSRLV
jgi:hypothetical protein